MSLSGRSLDKLRTTPKQIADENSFEAFPNSIRCLCLYFVRGIDDPCFYLVVACFTIRKNQRRQFNLWSLHCLGGYLVCTGFYFSQECLHSKTEGKSIVHFCCQSYFLPGCGIDTKNIPSSYSTVGQGGDGKSSHFWIHL